MASPDQDDLARVRAIADALDCVIEEDLQLLADYTAITVEAKRKRGKLPPHIRFGNRIFYPRAGLKRHFDSLVKEPPPPARDVL